MKYLWHKIVSTSVTTFTKSTRKIKTMENYVKISLREYENLKKELEYQRKQITGLESVISDIIKNPDTPIIIEDNFFAGNVRMVYNASSVLEGKIKSFNARINQILDTKLPFISFGKTVRDLNHGKL